MNRFLRSSIEWRLHTLWISTELARGFYIDAEAVRNARVREGRSFNAIHLDSAFEFDFFPVA